MDVNYPLAKANGLPASQVSASVGANRVSLAHSTLVTYYLHRRKFGLHHPYYGLYRTFVPCIFYVPKEMLGFRMNFSTQPSIYSYQCSCMNTL